MSFSLVNLSLDKEKINKSLKTKGKTSKAIVKESFILTVRSVIIVDLQHIELGLPKGTLLVSEKSGRSWTVVARILFDHAITEQRMFNKEATEYMLLKFDSNTKRQKSIDTIKQNESKHIFQYLLKPINHAEKPEFEELLEIVIPQQVI